VIWYENKPTVTERNIQFTAATPGRSVAQLPESNDPAGMTPADIMALQRLSLRQNAVNEIAQPSPFIYQYVRSTKGVMATLTEPMPSNLNNNPDYGDFGPLTINYLKAHGYTADVVQFIAHASSTFTDNESFSTYLANHGMAYA
jgi:hypothetical protein